MTPSARRKDGRPRAPTYAIALLPFTMVVLWAVLALIVEAREGGPRPEPEEPSCATDSDAGTGAGAR